MIWVLVRHRVRNYDHWREVFDDHLGFRRAGGEKRVRLFHSQGHPNDLVLLFQWSSLRDAQNFLKSADLKTAMQESGVVGKPDIWFLEEVPEAVPLETVLTGYGEVID